MTTTRIAEAMATLEELLGCLDDAYWEASNIEGKDRFYNLINAIQQELSELNKLSVQDHNLPYEVISDDFALAATEINELTQTPYNIIMRTKTARRFSEMAKALSKLRR